MPSLNFNLRCPKSIKPTQLYAVISVDKKQIKKTLGIKIYPFEWNKKKQICEVCNAQNEERINYLRVCNEKIFNFYFCFLNSFYIFASSSFTCEVLKEKEDNNLNKLNNMKETISENKQMILENLKIPRGETATKHLKKAWSGYSANLSKSSRRTRESHYKYIMKWIEDGNVTDSAKKLFNQEGFNKFKRQLEKDNIAIGNFNNRCQLYKKLVDYIIANQEKDYGFRPISLTCSRQTDKRNCKDEGKHFALKPEEIDKLYKSEMGKDSLKLWRNIFVFQCLCGMRQGDIFQKIIQKNYEIIENKGSKTLVFTPSKTEYSSGKKSYIPMDIDKRIEPLLEEITSSPTKATTLESFKVLYNKNIRRICEIAKLDREITYTDPRNKTITKPLYECVTSHCARDTMATNLLNAGKTKEFVMNVGGWNSEAMLNKCYDKRQKEEIVASMSKELHADKTSEKESQTEREILKKDTINALVFLGEDYTEIAELEYNLLWLRLREKESKIISLGIPLEEVKTIYNKDLTLKEKKEFLTKLLKKSPTTVE